MSCLRLRCAAAAALVVGLGCAACSGAESTPAAGDGPGRVVDVTAAPGATTTATPDTATQAGPSETTTLLFVGDVMLGRRVGELAALDPGSVFEDVRQVVGGADAALANLESPLTVRAHETDS